MPEGRGHRSGRTGVMTSVLWKGAVDEIATLLERWSVFAQVFPRRERQVTETDTEHWVRCRAEELGVESGHDVALLEAQDFLPPDIPEDAKETWREFPARLEFSDVRYTVRYLVSRRPSISTMLVANGEILLQ